MLFPNTSQIIDISNHNTIKPPQLTRFNKTSKISTVQYYFTKILILANIDLGGELIKQLVPGFRYFLLSKLDLF